MSFDDDRRKAQRRLPRMLFDYIDGGSYAETTLRRNVGDIETLALRQRVMVDGSKLDLGVTLFGEAMALPVILAPVGFAGMYARRGEVQAARAAESRQLQSCLSSLSICSIEEVRAAVTAPPWFQLYMIRDRGYMADLIARAWSCGVRVLVFTVDLPVAGTRYRDRRSGLLDPGMRGLARQAVQGLARPGWLWNVHTRGRPHAFGNFARAMAPGAGLGDQWAWVGENFDPGVSWADLAWVRSLWPGTIVIKGILDGDDAGQAIDHGADGIVVSNHGGRQLDGVRSSIAALPAIVDRVGGRATILMDGGIRSGLDVLKAVALGASAVMVGRSWAFALAAAGQRGVEAMIDRFQSELRVAMILTGCNDIAAAGRALIDDDAAGGSLPPSFGN
ncbi:L-lactate dehydrogenase [Glacieibacterium frigidum]|nr:L-lactate dehydrogenase [Glacieibacterium frigidum]